MNQENEKYMKMALKLAARGIGSVEPNPPVGCVIVKGGQVIGKGWHKKFGGPHAEINALEDCKNLGANPHGSDMYITLEPCCHNGKTPPCTDAIIAAKPAKVFVAIIDPSEHANGKSIEQLKEAGIDVETGLCQQQAELITAPFVKFATTSKPWVILKWAQSIDGKLALADSSPKDKYISSQESRKDVHSLRRRAQAILIGIGTVLEDNPMLTPRPARGRKPLRIILDNGLRIPLTSRLLTTTKTSPTLVVTYHGSIDSNPDKAERIRKKNVELLGYPDTGGQSNLYFVMDELAKRGIAQLLVEGGPTILTSFLREKIADEIRVYIVPKLLGQKAKASISQTTEALSDILELYHTEVTQFGPDVCISGLLKPPNQTIQQPQDKL